MRYHSTLSKIYLLFFVFMFGFVSHAQEISGKVFSENNTPIPYASIIINTDYGVISNGEGDFSINTEAFKPTDSVMISSLGFEELKFQLKDFKSKTYVLKESINALSEVFVTNKNLSVEDILERVIANIPQNYNSDAGEQQVFMRTAFSGKTKDMAFEIKRTNILKNAEKRAMNDTLSQYIESYKGNTSTSYKDILATRYFLKDSVTLNVTKATRLINKKRDNNAEKLSEGFLEKVTGLLDKEATYKVKTGLLKVEDSLKIEIDKDDDRYSDKPETANLKSSINKIIKSHTIGKSSRIEDILNLDNYDFTLDGSTRYNSENVYVINFKPSKRRSDFEGRLYVSPEDFAIIRMDYNLLAGEKGTNLNLKFLLGIKVQENKIDVSIIYKKNKAGKYALNFIKESVGTYVFLERPFKLKKNLVSRDDDREVLKIKFLIENENLTKKELFFIESNSISESEFFKKTEPKTYTLDYVKAYNPKDWEQYNIINPINDIIEYSTTE